MKKILITGASSGLGLMLSRYYDEKGFNLVTIGRDRKKINSLKKEISKEEIVKLEIATGEPIFYEFNENKLQRKLNW